MSTDLLELECLVYQHDVKENCGCDQCRRIEELRIKLGDNRENRYEIEFVETGEKVKFPSKVDIAKRLGIATSTLHKWMNDGFYDDIFIVRKLKEEER